MWLNHDTSVYRGLSDNKEDSGPFLICVNTLELWLKVRIITLAVFLSAYVHVNKVFYLGTYQECNFLI